MGIVSGENSTIRELSNVADVLTIQEEIANSVADKLALSEPVLSAHRGQTNRLDAYERYLKGRYYWTRRGQPNQHKAIAYFKQAIAIDPQYALAHSGLADAEVLLGEGSLDANASRDLYRRAEASALEALRLDETLAQAHCSLARVAMQDWRRDQAETEFKRCLQLDPNYATAHGWYALFLTRRNRHAEALTEARIGVRLDPFSPAIFSQLGWPLLALGRYEEGIAAIQRSVTLTDTNHHNLGLAYLAAGRFVEARSEFDIDLRQATTPGQRNRTAASIGIVSARSGDRKAALQILEQLKHSPGVAPISLARLYSALGDKENAIRILQQMVADHDVTLVQLKSDAAQIFDSLRSDPRFQRLVEIYDAGGKLPLAPAERRTSRPTPGSPGLSRFLAEKTMLRYRIELPIVFGATRESPDSARTARQPPPVGPEISLDREQRASVWGIVVLTFGADERAQELSPAGRGTTVVAIRS